MLRTITDATVLEAAQLQFTRRIAEASARTEAMQLGLQGGGLGASVHFLADLKIWVALSRESWGQAFLYASDRAMQETRPDPRIPRSGRLRATG